ncbi:MAG: hypothetical protein ASARMPREDX12_005640 [Alectoria sarmentosa]|nr:MAG: hypothetical protein ASARMPRED_004800 [Alectoria sarmentosa]CAD6592069.1 MAG: hypothetical protein ASARMPREDX12_005640 [Alectoria sarmentosa]
MAQKCVHKGCGKPFTNPEEECVYHPGPPVFHEGQKGWKCCKPRFLTFDEFLSIPPCTTGNHSTVEEKQKNHKPPSSEVPEDVPPPPVPIATNGNTQNLPAPRASQPAPPAAPSPAPPETDSDDPSIPVPPNTICRRRGCNATSTAQLSSSRGDEQCIYHPGQALFHEGSKGWTCCKRRVLEFDEFMKIEGCTRKINHLFVGNKKKSAQEEAVSEVRHDFYQTPTSVIASLFLKKIHKDRAKVEFTSQTAVVLDLPTADNKRYKTELPLFGHIDTAQSTYKIMGTKLEMTLVKADGLSWPTLRSDEQRTSGIIQVGHAGRA